MAVLVAYGGLPSFGVGIEVELARELSCPLTTRPGSSGWMRTPRDATSAPRASAWGSPPTPMPAS